MISSGRWCVIAALAALCCSATVAGPVQNFDLRDPTPAGPGVTPTAGEILEQALPFTYGAGQSLTASPSGSDLAGDGLLANDTSFGIDSNGASDVAHQIQTSLSEALTLIFSGPIALLSIDLSNVGSSAADGATITIGSFSVTLHTGVAGFDGTSDIYTPATPIIVQGGTPIVFSGSGASSSFGLQSILAEIPEPATAAVLAATGLSVILADRRRRRAV